VKAAELLLALLVVVAVLVTISRRIHVPYPVLLLLGGLVVGLVPGIPRLELDPRHDADVSQVDHMRQAGVPPGRWWRQRAING